MNEEFMKLANSESLKNKKNNYQKGGPFGAIIVDENNKIIAKAHNTVIKSKDPTAHAEINAIRKACKVRKSHDLKGCTLYTSCYPCPMCLSALIWANIKIVYYGNTKEEADNIGFRDDLIYEYIKKNDENILKLNQCNHDLTIETFKDYKDNYKSNY